MSVGLSLSMLIARQAVDDKITAVKSSIGNTISITPAGMRGFEGGGEALTSEQMGIVTQTDHVTTVLQTLSDRLTTETTDLESSIEAGTLGNRAQSNSGVGFEAPPEGTAPPTGQTRSPNTSAQITRTFTPPVTISGISDSSATSVYGGDSVSFTSGESLDASKDENVAVLGKAIAEKNGLSVGSTFTAYDQAITVVGVYDAGNAFANNGIITSLPTLQRLSEQSGAITSATVTVDSVDNMNSTVKAIETTLGDSADVVSNQSTAQTAVEPLESVKTISTYSAIGALAAGAIIILMTMMMIVRERRREIGVMKAIGSTNSKTMVQFASEAVTLTFLGLVVGLIMSIFAAQPITKMLVNNSSSATTSQTQGPGGGMGRPGSTTGNALRSVKDVQTSIGADIIAYGIAVAFAIAILGSALPAYFISKVRPAEVMRAD